MKRNEYMIWYDVCIQILMYKIRYWLRFFFFCLFFFISIPPFIITKKKKKKKRNLPIHDLADQGIYKRREGRF